MTRVLVLLAAVALLAGCGNKTGPKNLEQTTSTSSAAQAMQTFQLEAAPNGALRFSIKSLKATSDHVQLLLTNASKVPHNIAVKGHGVDRKGRVVSGGAESRLDLNLKPGTYEFYCSVDGHEQAGMKGTLIVGAPS